MLVFLHARVDVVHKPSAGRLMLTGGVAISLEQSSPIYPFEHSQPPIVKKR